MRIPRKNTLAALLLTLTLTTLLHSQELGYWRAASQTSRDITGDIAFSADKLSINFLAFTIARIRTLTPAETDAAFNPDPGTQGAGSLYRLDIPSSRKFLHKNTLCGTDDTKWMATYASGRSLSVSFFSDDKPPTLTHEALTDSTTLCGTYTYVR